MLGAAWIADIALLPAIAASNNGMLVALASRDVDRARRILAPYAGALALDSYDDVLADPDIECVYIPLVNNLHQEWTKRALSAGKHVLCEKPLAMNEQQAEEMAAAAASSGLHLMEAFMYRFNPAVRAFVESARDAIHVEASFGFQLDQEPNYRWQAELGGGALLDVGCYTVSVARWVMGEPVDVVSRAHMQGGVDVSAAALLQFDGGRTASVWASLESAEGQAVTAVTRQQVLRLDRPFNPLHDWLDQYRLMVESFGDSVLHGEPVAIPFEESIANMRVLDRIRAGFSS